MEKIIDNGSAVRWVKVTQSGRSFRFSQRKAILRRVLAAKLGEKT